MSKKKDEKNDAETPDNAEYEEGDDDGKGLAVVGGDADEGEYKNKDIREKVLRLLAEAESRTWDLSVILEDVYARDLYREWSFDSFREYVEKELNINTRWSQILVQLQEWFKKLPLNIQQWVLEIGSTKARMLMSIVTVENAAEWRNKIAGKSVAEIKKMLQAAKGEGGGGEGGEGGDDGDGADDKPKTMNFKLFSEQYQNVTRALEKGKEIANSEKTGNVLDLICTEFLATNAGIDSVQDMLRKMEKTLGVRLVAYVEEDDSVAYGADLIRDLEKKDRSGGEPDEDPKEEEKETEEESEEIEA